MSYAYAEGVVWLEPLSPESHPMVHDLCAQHAASVRVPQGWELRDEFHQQSATLLPQSLHLGPGMYQEPEQLNLIVA